MNRSTTHRLPRIHVRLEAPVCYVQFANGESGNTIDARFVQELHAVLAEQTHDETIVVLSGTPEVFCMGADFTAIAGNGAAQDDCVPDAGSLYDLWLRLANGPFITVSHVRGKVNAGGMGFVAASDIVLADVKAQFSLSEMLFGLFPACVWPFLASRVGLQRAHYLTLMTHPIDAAQACQWGLVDAVDANSESLLHRHLLRLRKLSRASIAQYKQYRNSLYPFWKDVREVAVAANTQLFSDENIRRGIRRYVNEGVPPWETLMKR